MRTFYWDQKKTQPVEGKQIWGVRHRFSSTVAEVEGPELRDLYDDNYHLVALRSGEWVRVWAKTGRPAGAIDAAAVSHRTLARRRAKAREMQANEGSCG